MAQPLPNTDEGTEELRPELQPRQWSDLVSWLPKAHHGDSSPTSLLSIVEYRFCLQCVLYLFSVFLLLPSAYHWSSEFTTVTRLLLLPLSNSMVLKLGCILEMTEEFLKICHRVTWLQDRPVSSSAALVPSTSRLAELCPWCPLLRDLGSLRVSLSFVPKAECPPSS